MTWVDGVILLVILVSGLLAFLRGLVREVLGIGAWIGAAILAVWATPFVRPRFQGWFADRPGLAEPIAYAVLFLVCLGVLLFISHRISRVVRGSALGGLDRTLGLLFGLARGAALIVNCPGSPGGAREALEVILPVLDHALDLLAGGHPH